MPVPISYILLGINDPTIAALAGGSQVTAQDLIDQARIRHWSFADIALGDGAAILFLNQRQRTLLLQYGQTVEPLASTSTSLAAQVNGGLVAFQNGAPVYANTVQDGWVLHQDANGVPYVNFAEVPAAVDPFGQNGGVPGFPLPADFVKLTAVFLVYEAGLQGPCRIVEERERMQEVQRLGPAAFVSGNRLVPVRPLASGNSNDAWSTVQTVQLSYLAMPVIQALTDPVAWPAVLCDALVASLADLFAMSSKACPASDKARFAKEAAASAEAIGEAGIDILGSLTQHSVLFKG